MQLQETIFCSTGPSSSNSSPGTISFHDIQTGSALASFKQTSAGTHCTAVVQSRDGKGGFVLAAQPEKSIMNVYNFQKDQVVLKIVLPEKLSCIATDPRGDYCAGGTSQGRIYLWEIASGIMYNSWDAHYRQINVLRFSNDGAALIAGSEDSAVSVWSVSRLLDDDLQDDPPMAYCTLSDHTLPVTDVVCGVGRFPSCRILSASVDHSVKLWDLRSKTILTTFQFPHPITSLAWDPTERLFFAATASGLVHQMNLFRQREDKLGRGMIETVGGAGASDVFHITDDDAQTTRKRLINVGHPISTLAISLTSSLLLIGLTTGLINIYDTASHQLLRTISAHKGLAITYLSTMLKPPDLVGHVSLSMSVGTADAKDAVPVKPVAAFQRMRDAKSREAHEVAILFPAQSTSNLTAILSYSDEEMNRDHSFFVQPSGTGAEKTGVALQSRVTELESEVARLREQLGKAKGVNDVMWETVVHRLVAEEKEKAKSNGGIDKNGDVIMAQGDDAGESERRRKRGRIQ